MEENERNLGTLFLDKFRKKKNEKKHAEYRPENLDPQRITEFLGNWRFEKGINGWEFAFPKNTEEPTEVLLEISRRFVRISTPTIGDIINMRLIRPDVKRIKILGENNQYAPNRLDNPRLCITTKTGSIFLYRDRLDVIETVNYSKDKYRQTESKIPFGEIAAVNKLSRKLV